MRVSGVQSTIPLFGRVLHHSSVPTKNGAAVARRAGPGRPNGRREAALPWTGTSTAECWRSVGTGVRAVGLLFLTLTMGDAAAVAGARAADHTASTCTDNPFARFIDEASRHFGVPTHWICAVLDVESAGDVRATSPKGAMGLMQILPETWDELRLRYHLGNDPYDPHDNILAGTAYLRELYDRYGSPGFLAAYNAGPARYEEHLDGRRLPAETQTYLAKLAPTIGSDIAASRLVANLRPSATTLFVVLSESSKNATSAQLGHIPKRALIAVSAHDISAIVPQAPGLFVARSDAGGRR